MPSEASNFGDRYWRIAPEVANVVAVLTGETVAPADFRALADNLPTLCWIANGDGYIVWYNRRWHDYCGTTPAQMEGWGWTMTHDPAVLPRVVERWTACISSGEPFEMTFPLRGADGVFRPFLSRVQPIRAPGGEVIRWFGVNTDVSRQIAAETARDVERERRREVLDNMPDAFALLDQEFQVLDVNPATLAIDGRARHEIVGRIYWDVWPGGEQSTLAEGFRRALAEQIEVRTDTHYTWPDGREGWYEVRAFPSEKGLALVSRDATRERIAQAALDASQALLRDIVAQMHSGLIIAEIVRDADGRGCDWIYVDVNPAWERLLGISREQAVGRRVTEVLPGIEPHWVASLIAGLDTGKPYVFDAPVATLDRWYEGHAFRIGQDRLGITFTEATARVQREAALQQRAQENAAERDRLWEASPDLLIVLGFDGIIHAVNPGWTTTLGWQEHELIGQKYHSFVHPDDIALTQVAVEHASCEALATSVNRYRHIDGSYRWIDWKAVPDETAILASGRDVTAERQARAELEATQNALRQAQKMEAVGQLTGGIAHDFNNMLAVVIGSLDLLERRLAADDARARRYVSAASEGARRAAALTQRLLAFSRQQPLRPEIIEPNRLVAGMSDLLRHSLGAQVRLETVLAGGLWRVHADPNQLESAILNLAVNARDAMPGGGRLTIETRNAAIGLMADEYAGLIAGEYVQIAVTDTGTGMTPEVIAKAYDPFFTTKPVGKGTGLGLSQVYGFVTQSGGHIRIDSIPDCGTTLEISLPRLVGGPDAVLSKVASGEMPGDGTGELILVVEDETAVRHFRIEALTELGYRTIEAGDGEAALAQLTAHAEVALMFTDVVMPGMDGRRLADRARAARPALRVLFTTGYARDAALQAEAGGPGVDLIAKPFTVEALAIRVRAVLDAPVRVLPEPG